MSGKGRVLLDGGQVLLSVEQTLIELVTRLVELDAFELRDVPTRALGSLKGLELCLPSNVSYKLPLKSRMSLFNVMGNSVRKSLVRECYPRSLKMLTDRLAEVESLGSSLGSSNREDVLEVPILQGPGAGSTSYVYYLFSCCFKGLITQGGLFPSRVENGAWMVRKKYVAFVPRTENYRPQVIASKQDFSNVATVKNLVHIFDMSETPNMSVDESQAMHCAGRIYCGSVDQIREYLGPQQRLGLKGSAFQGSAFQGSAFQGSAFQGSAFQGSAFQGSMFENDGARIDTDAYSPAPDGASPNVMYGFALPGSWSRNDRAICCLILPVWGTEELKICSFWCHAKWARKQADALVTIAGTFGLELKRWLASKENIVSSLEMSRKACDDMKAITATIPTPEALVLAHRDIFFSYVPAPLPKGALLQRHGLGIRTPTDDSGRPVWTDACEKRWVWKSKQAEEIGTAWILQHSSGSNKESEIKNVEELLYSLLVEADKPPPSPEEPGSTNEYSPLLLNQGMEPDAVEPDAVKPDAVEPDAAQHDAAQHDAVQHDAVQHDAVQHDAAVNPVEQDGAGEQARVVEQDDVLEQDGAEQTDRLMQTDRLTLTGLFRFPVVTSKL
ncbi:hypothetical protein GNI_169370 [Gregarina niphandrodes]|uniref:Uncharacterized protein n=1 Tax=Gregarina niphandrodes TaxID=110365 RepID=A0A023AYK4_GRENI|nr:hypothetical protein GNI_169370 [Gregarina niphandrodes]EZG43513.1 hypothetical protein GNI_169370 [Gregarina niphandrodes]|eukprot:XP_011133263.1 hypothetical protein GNI_169370 [Gregarina niphandrodes]